jgi:alpha-L-rhamnosidase
MAQASPCRVVRLRCDWQENPIGTDNPTPRLSWALADERTGAAQKAWQVQVTAGGDGIDERRLTWDSGRVRSASMAGNRYGGAPLAPGTRAWWRVRTWDRDGRPTAWSEPAFWETGMTGALGRGARWIGMRHSAKDSLPCRFLRMPFAVGGPVARARLYVTARGLVEPWINGEKVSADSFVPGWSDYHKRLHVVTYDVTSFVRQGDNVLGAILAEGWYSGYLLWFGTRNHYGDTPSLLALLRVETSDGRVEEIASDGSWKAATGPLLFSDIYHGENYDARLEMPGWSGPGFDDSRWRSADELPAEPGARLSGRPEPAVRAIREMTPLAVTTPRPGAWIYDLGQNMVGRARVRLAPAPAGTEVVLRFAEMLNPDGTMYTANLRTARATDRYVCRGGGEETVEPRFTFHGFRYVEVAAPTRPLDVRGVVMHSVMEPAGELATSDRLLTQLASNIAWGQRGNFLEVPTDCPQRDERLGWTGDAQIFMPTACFNFDVASFFARWLRDVEDAQNAEGAFPHVVPDVLTPSIRGWKDAPLPGAAAWADAGVICPWTHYVYYGDPALLEEHYESMKSWIAFQERTSHDLVRPDNGFGDWLDPDVTRPGVAPTPRDLVGTAYFARTAGIMTRVAAVLGKREDAAAFASLRARVVRAFRREFVSPAGRVVGDTQTGCCLALAFDLLAPAGAAIAFDRLLHLVESRNRHLSTGFVGTPLLLPVLTRFGRPDVAYDVLFQTDYPGWLYPVTNGATTMWERWNSWTKEGGFGDVSMNSFNHYAYGAVGEWMYAAIGGIAVDERHPGFRRFVVEPLADRRITSARCRHVSPFGEIRTRWERAGGELALELVVPPGSGAEVRLPTQAAAAVRVGGRPPREAEGVQSFRQEPARAVLAVGAGSYRFTCPQP